MIRPLPESVIPVDETAGGRSSPFESRFGTAAWKTALVLLCLCTLGLLFRHIERSLPYPLHVDEGFISGPAANVLKTGSLHPTRFNYPSLPTYLAAAAMSFGFLRAAGQLEIRDIQRIGEVGYPYYETARVMQSARQVFALMAVLCVAMTGWAAWMASRRPATLVLAPLILVSSPLFFRHSWVYLNVDIIGASFVILTVVAALVGTRQPSLWQCALLPGALAGFATASKYTLAVVILPVLLSIGLFFPRDRRIVAMATAFAAMVVAFAAAMPYSLLDIPGFLSGVGYETFHYASGHAGFAGDPGWPQLRYYLHHLVSEFGWPAAVLAVGGIFALVVADWRRAVVLLMFPAALLWLLSMQRVHFTRNVLSVHPFVAVFASLALVSLANQVLAFAARRSSLARSTLVRVVLVLGLVAAAIPVWRFVDYVRDRTDSRKLARAWIDEHLPPDWTLVIPTELNVDRRGMDAGGRRIVVVELRHSRHHEAVQALFSSIPGPAVLMAPRWGADRRTPGQSAANALNEVSRQWRVLQTFGTNDVLYNYAVHTAWGDPAFALAVIK
jgi:hypothetical protein